MYTPSLIILHQRLTALAQRRSYKCQGAARRRTAGCANCCASAVSHLRENLNDFFLLNEGIGMHAPI